jgi:hypothetical protein
MKKKVFTLCSNNYLAQAKVLYESLLAFNPDFLFVIGLVDKKSEAIDYATFIPCEVVEIESIFKDSKTFSDMYSRYNITEINTAVKPFFFQYLLENCQDDDQVYYFDPDIEIFASLDELVSILKTNNVVLTPHLLSPIFDDQESPPSESFINNAGLYNLGFMGLKKSEESKRLLHWWADKCEKNCYIKQAQGIFVDQSWISHAPIFFDKVHVLLENNYNVAYWNLHERVVKNENGKYKVNNENPLVFFHFSGYNPLNTEILAKYQFKYNFSDLPSMKPLFDEYANKLMAADYMAVTNIKCYYEPIVPKSTLKTSIKNLTKKYLLGK